MDESIEIVRTIKLRSVGDVTTIAPTNDGSNAVTVTHSIDDGHEEFEMCLCFDEAEAIAEAILSCLEDQREEFGK